MTLRYNFFFYHYLIFLFAHWLVPNLIPALSCLLNPTDLPFPLVLPAECHTMSSSSATASFWRTEMRGVLQALVSPTRRQSRRRTSVTLWTCCSGSSWTFLSHQGGHQHLERNFDEEQVRFSGWVFVLTAERIDVCWSSFSYYRERVINIYKRLAFLSLFFVCFVFTVFKCFSLSGKQIVVCRSQQKRVSIVNLICPYIIWNSEHPVC